MSDDEMMFPMSPLDGQSPREQSPKREAEADPINDDPLIFEENRERDTVDADHRRLLRLMTQFTMGYDPTILPAMVSELYPFLWEGMFPGSYNHLLVILFSSMSDMEHCQIDMHTWMLQNFQFKHRTTRSKSDMLDETIFGSELEMLKKLLLPVRLRPADPVFWLNTRRPDSTELCAQTCNAMEVLDSFQLDLLDTLENLVEFESNIEPKHDSGPPSESIVSMRSHRLVACQGTMHWGNTFRSFLEFTDFHSFYSTHLIDTNLEKAQDYGFAPPDDLSLAEEVIEDAEGDIPTWPCEERKRMVMDLVLRTAVWLGLARGFSALQLFCDVARHFNLTEPDENVTLPRLYFLNRFVRLRVAPSEKIPDCIKHTPTPTLDKDFPGENPDYFMDVAESHRKLAGEFDKKLTLVQKKMRQKDLNNFNLQQPPRNRDEMLARRQSLPGPEVVHRSKPIPIDPEKRPIQMIVETAEEDDVDAASIKTADSEDEKAELPPLVPPGRRDDHVLAYCT